MKESNANINQLSRQLEVLKQQTAEFIKTRRELEQENDHLERTERYVVLEHDTRSSYAVVIAISHAILNILCLVRHHSP